MERIDQIYRLYASSVYRYLLSISSNSDLAEELTQEVFYQATKSIQRYNGACKIFVWLCQIGKHLYLDHLKREKRFNRFADWEHLEQTATDSIFDLPEDVLDIKEDMRYLFKTIQALPSQQQEVMLLRAIGDLSFQEVGELMGRSENWARVTFYRAKLKLQERVGNNE